MYSSFSEMSALFFVKARAENGSFFSGSPPEMQLPRGLSRH